MEVRNRVVVWWGRVSVLQMKRVLEIGHNSVHVFNTIVHIKMFKIVAFMLCAFYHSESLKKF